MSKKLWYITTATLNPKAANAIQVLAMARAFSSNLGEQFSLVSPAVGDAQQTDFEWEMIPCKFSRRIFRYPELIIRVAVSGWPWRKKSVFTRDIGVALILSLLGANVSYEVHHVFRTIIGSFLFRLTKSRIQFVVISRALKSYLQENFKISEKRILIAHDGADISAFSVPDNFNRNALREELDLPIDKDIIVFTGSLVKHIVGGGIGLIRPGLEHFPELLVVVVGGSEREIEKLRKEFYPMSNIKFVPRLPQNEAKKYMMIADLLYFPMTEKTPDWWCTSPLKLFEYMATGIPVIGSKVGSSGEVISDKNALLFDPSEKDSIVSALQFFYQNREAVNERAKSAKKMVEQKYTWIKRAENISGFVFIK